jgi:hypothetical protein
MLHEQQRMILMQSNIQELIHSACEYTMFALAQLLRNWREQQHSDQGDKVAPVVLYGCETWSLTLREHIEGVSEQSAWNIWPYEG